MKAFFAATIIMASLATAMFYFFGVTSTIWKDISGAPPPFLFLLLGIICSANASYTYSLGDKEQKTLSVEIPGGRRMPLPPPPPGYVLPNTDLRKVTKKEIQERDDRIWKLKAELDETKDKLADFEAAKKLAPEPAAAAQPAQTTSTTQPTPKTSEVLEFTI
jgi:hypothetical protein